jgi:hypothetical protein
MANDLLEREEQAAGNSDDGLNVGQKNSDATFNKKEGGHDEIEGYDRSADGLDDYDEEEFGKRKDPEYTDVHGDKVKSNYNADDPTDDIKAKEETGGPSLYSGSGSGGGGGFNFQAALKGSGRNVGPTSGVVGLVLFALSGLGGGSMGLASSLVINMKEIFHNDRSDATRTNRIFSRAFISNKVHNTKDCAGIKVKCKMSSMSKAQFESYKEQGFKIKGDVIDKDGKTTGEQADDNKSKINDPANNDGSRVKVSEITFPDKTTASTGKDFFAHADKSLNAQRAAERGFNSKSSFYQNKFFSKFLADKFGFSKAKKAFPQDDDKDKAKDKAEKDKAFNEQSGGQSDADAEKNKAQKAKQLSDEAGSETKKRAKKGGGVIAGTMRAVCSAYTLANTAEALVKIYHGLQLAKYALLFLQAADEIKDGRGDGPKTTYLSDSLTSYEPNKELLEDSDLGKKGDPNPKYNLSATDSEGYKTAALGDKSGLKDFSKKYLLGGGVGEKLSDVTSAVEGVASSLPFLPGKTDRQKTKNFCRTINGNIANIASSCAALGVTLVTIGSFVPIVGNIVGLAIDGLVCTCSFPKSGALPQCALLNYLVDKARDVLIDQLKDSDQVKGAIQSIVKSLNVGSDTKGVDAGNAIAAGVGVTMSAGAVGYGQRPSKSAGNNKDVSDFITYTQPLEDKYIALEKDDARLNPLDLDNKYSLVGSLARSLNLAAVTPNSLYGNITTLSSLLPTSFGSLFGVSDANALYNQPSTAADGAGGRYKNCEDKDLAELDDGNGATGDTYCSIVGISTKTELDKASAQAYDPGSKEIDELTDRMLKSYQDGDGSDKPSIDQDGKPIGYDPAGSSAPTSQYGKFLKYCTQERKAPWGAQLEGYEEGSGDDQEWFSGNNCMKDTKMLMDFRMWTNYCLQSGTMDGQLNCYTDSAASPAKSSQCAGGGNAAIYTCALKYDNYRYLWGGGHSGNAQQFIADFNAGKTPEWTQILDCSGLVRMAYVEAMGVEDGAYTAPDGYIGSANWDKIDVKDAVQGDIITQSGHVAIVESNDGANELKIFDAETDGGAQEDNIRHSTASYGSVLGAFRAKKP